MFFRIHSLHLVTSTHFYFLCLSCLEILRDPCESSRPHLNHRSIQREIKPELPSPWLSHVSNFLSFISGKALNRTVRLCPLRGFSPLTKSFQQNDGNGRYEMWLSPSSHSRDARGRLRSLTPASPTRGTTVDKEGSYSWIRSVHVYCIATLRKGDVLMGK
jgi:hypothetical protein